MIACGADRGDGLFHPCCGACDVLGCWYTRSAGGIDKADAARSEPSPVGDATTSVGRALTDDHGPSRECSNGPDHAIGGGG